MIPCPSERVTELCQFPAARTFELIKLKRDVFFRHSVSDQWRRGLDFASRLTALFGCYRLRAGLGVLVLCRALDPM